MIIIHFSGNQPALDVDALLRHQQVVVYQWSQNNKSYIKKQTKMVWETHKMVSLRRVNPVTGLCVDLREKGKARRVRREAHRVNNSHQAGWSS